MATLLITIKTSNSTTYDNEVVKMDDILMFIKTFVQLEDISRNNPQQISVCWASLHLVF